MFDVASLSFLHVLIGGLLYFAVGSVWYSPIMFGPLWMRLAKKKESDMKKSDIQRAMIGSIISGVVLSAAYALLSQGIFELKDFICLSLILAGGFTATTGLMQVLYHGKKWSLYFLSLGYEVVGLLLLAIFYYYV
jgi:hypothetical protein